MCTSRMMHTGVRILADAKSEAPSAKLATSNPSRENTVVSTSRTAGSSSTTKISPAEAASSDIVCSCLFAPPLRQPERAYNPYFISISTDSRLRIYEPDEEREFHQEILFHVPANAVGPHLGTCILRI